MSSAKKRSTTRGNNISPSSSPPLPPPPSQAQSNRGVAAPHHYETVLASPGLVSASASTYGSGNGKNKGPTNSSSPSSRTTTSNNVHTSARPQKTVAPTLSYSPADVVASARGSVHRPPVLRRKQKRVFRRWVARLLLLYLGYTFLFICPRVDDPTTNVVCESVVRAQDWLRPYTDPVVEKVDETYRVYGAPLVDQYGRPLYQQGQHYYYEYAEPAFKTTSVKAVDTYYQYAHPQVIKACDALYTDNVKTKVHQAQTSFNHYHKQAHSQVEFLKKKSKETSDHLWHIHSTHVQPVVDKVSPHAKVAWNKASLGANKVYAGATVLYLTHVNPYAERSWVYIREAMDQARDVVTEKADSVFGTSLHNAKGTRRKATKKGRHAKTDAQKIVKEFVDTVSDTVAKKAHDAQKVVHDEAEYLKKLADEKVHAAGKISDQIKKTVIEKAHEAQEAVARGAENMKHSAEEQVEKIQEAGAHLKEAVVGSIYSAEEAVEQEIEHLEKAAAQRKASMEKFAKQEANALRNAAIRKEKEAERALKDASKQAQKQVHHAYEAAEHEAHIIRAKAAKAEHDAEKSARKYAKDAQAVVEKQIKHAQEIAHEDAEWVQRKAHKVADDAVKATEGFKHAVEETVHHAQHVAEEDAAWVKQKASDTAERIRDSAEESLRAAQKAAQKAEHDAADSVYRHAHEAEEAILEEASYLRDAAAQYVISGKDKVEHAKDAVNQKSHDAQVASKVALAAVLAGIERTFNQFHHYEETETNSLWEKLQSAIDEHIANAKKSAKELEHANKETYETFEAYVKNWANEAGDFEKKMEKLGQRQGESIKKIGQRAEDHQGAAKVKTQTLKNNVEVYIAGLRDFLAERLAASKETLASELRMFTDTSSEDDKKSARAKLAVMELSAKDKLEKAGSEAREKSHELLKQVEHIWNKSQSSSKEYVQRTRELALRAGEDAKVTLQHSTKKESHEHGHHHNHEHTHHEHKHQHKVVKDGNEPNVRVAEEEPGSGHRHHRHG
ncbi:hypothetical protein BGZ94_007841 [Podila epigama]|nr:hypothetical protein BGZ94_007841 [Podila epigama]